MKLIFLWGGLPGTCSVTPLLSVCLRVLGTWVICAKTAEPIEMPFRGLTRVGPRNHALIVGPDPSGEGALLVLRGHMNTHCNVPIHECIAHCSPAAAGECACRA